MSLVDGSYEYYHYLHDGIDDNVRSLFFDLCCRFCSIQLNCYFAAVASISTFGSKFICYIWEAGT